MLEKENQDHIETLLDKLTKQYLKTRDHRLIDEMARLFAKLNNPKPMTAQAQS